MTRLDDPIDFSRNLTSKLNYDHFEPQANFSLIGMRYRTLEIQDTYYNIKSCNLDVKSDKSASSKIQVEFQPRNNTAKTKNDLGVENVHANIFWQKKCDFFIFLVSFYVLFTCQGA